MEFVASIVQASDLVSQEAIFLNLCRRVLRHLGTILAHTQADIVLQVGMELPLCNILVLKEVGLLLEHSEYHSASVRLCIHHAGIVTLSCILIVWVAVHKHFVCMASRMFRIHHKRLLVWLAWRCSTEFLLIAHYFFYKYNYNLFNKK